AEIDPSKLPAAAQTAIDFNRDIRPLFERSCFRCHGPERPKSGFRLDAYRHVVGPFLSTSPVSGSSDVNRPPSLSRYSTPRY
ncbi:MAG: hypothetical protein HYZ37_13160, partial [Candidatus Solibacter usitatus]|nr:hypothetical protein [Candidatus Solibacter usitatus]